MKPQNGCWIAMAFGKNDARYPFTSNHNEQQTANWRSAVHYHLSFNFLFYFIFFINLLVIQN